MREPSLVSFDVARRLAMSGARPQNEAIARSPAAGTQAPPRSETARPPSERLNAREAAPIGQDSQWQDSNPNVARRRPQGERGAGQGLWTQLGSGFSGAAQMAASRTQGNGARPNTPTNQQGTEFRGVAQEAGRFGAEVDTRNMRGTPTPTQGQPVSTAQIGSARPATQTSGGGLRVGTSGAGQTAAPPAQEQPPAGQQPAQGQQQQKTPEQEQAERDAADEAALRNRLGTDDLDAFAKSIGYTKQQLLELHRQGYYIFRSRRNGHVYAMRKETVDGMQREMMKKGMHPISNWGEWQQGMLENDFQGLLDFYVNNPDRSNSRLFLSPAEGIENFLSDPGYNEAINRSGPPEKETSDAERRMLEIINTESPVEDPRVTQARIRARQRENQLRNAQNMRALMSSGARTGATADGMLGGMQDFMQKANAQADSVRSEEELRTQIQNLESQRMQYSNRIQALRDLMQADIGEEQQLLANKLMQQQMQLQNRLQQDLMQKQFELDNTIGAGDFMDLAGAALGGVTGALTGKFLGG